MMRGLALAVAVIAATSVGCGSSDSADSNAITARALAAITEDHLDQQMGGATSSGLEIDGPRAVGGVGAEVRFRVKGEPSTPVISASIGDKASAAEFTCTRLKADYNGCVAVDGGTLFWENETPEEDPGVIYMALRKGDATVLIFQSGPLVSTDPRKLDLRISIKDMFAIAEDPRVDLTTSAAAIRAGQKLDSWKGKSSQPNDSRTP